MVTTSITWRRCGYTGHMILSTAYRSRMTINVINASYSNFVPQLQPAEKSVQWNKCLLKINTSNHFIGKRPAKKVFVSFFFSPFLSTAKDQNWLAARVVLPIITSHFTPRFFFTMLVLWSSLVVIFDIIIIRIFDDSSVCSLFFSWFKFGYVWVWESRLTNICVNRFLSVITFLMGLSTEVSSSLGFN